MRSHTYYQSDPNGLFDSIELEDSLLEQSKEPIALELIEELPEEHELPYNVTTNIRGAAARGHICDCSA